MQGVSDADGQWLGRVGLLSMGCHAKRVCGT